MKNKFFYILSLSFFRQIPFSGRIHFYPRNIQILLIIGCLSFTNLSFSQKGQGKRESLFGVKLNQFGVALLAKVEISFKEKVREEWYLDTNRLKQAAYMVVSDDGIPTIFMNKLFEPKLDVIIHELYHFILRVQGYPTIRWLIPRDIITDESTNSLNQMIKQLYDPMLHYIFYATVRKKGINPGESFEERANIFLNDGVLDIEFNKKDTTEIALYYLKISLELSDSSLKRKLITRIRKLKGEGGIELGQKLHGYVTSVKKYSPEALISVFTKCLNTIFEDHVQFTQQPLTIRQLGKFTESVAPIKVRLKE